MKVTVYYMAQLKQAAGIASEVIEWNQPGSTMELVRHLANQHGERLTRSLLDGRGQLQPTILMFVNDVQVTSEKEIILQDGDEVSFLSPIAGGVR